MYVCNKGIGGGGGLQKFFSALWTSVWSKNKGCGEPFPWIRHSQMPFTWENQKFRLENQKVHAIPFGKVQKIWDVIWVVWYNILSLFSRFSWFE